MREALVAGLVSVGIVAFACSSGSSSTPTPVPTDTSPPPATATQPPPAPTFAPPAISPTTEIQVPEGFTAYRIADGFQQPTAVTVGPDGRLYVTDRFEGAFQLRDNDGDGFFEDHIQILPDPHAYTEITGLVVSASNDVYVGDRGRVTRTKDTNGDGLADEVTHIITGLPVGRHQNDGLEFGPDGLLYIGGGSTCDDCVQLDPRSAAILRANPDGSNLEVYASGIRNSYDIAFDAQGRLWATDNGEDGIDPPYCATIDELNLIEQGADYGWPYAPGCDPFNDGTPPVVSLGLHTASTGIDDYSGTQFPTDYQGDLFFTLWGSFVFDPEFNPELYHYTPGDDTIEQFTTGLENPIDVFMDHDGTLLVLDYGRGALYRIAYTGP